MATDEHWIGNRYQLLDLIGVGGMGKVYRAHDMLTDTMVALKQVMIPNEQIITNSSPDPTQQSDLTLAIEFRTLATLRHPHIISVLDYGFDEDHRPYFTMEFLENAQSITQVAARVSNDVKLTLIVQMLQALSYLHRRGILHRDLKPDNVLVTEVDNGMYAVRVLDFGLASTFDVDDSASSLVGTLAYLAPEIIQEQPATLASDLYAAGMIMYEVLAGKYPFDTSYVAELMQSILYFRPRIPAPGIERPIGAIIRKLLDKSPTERYADAETVLSAIEDVSTIDLATENVAVRESFLQSAKFVGREDEFAKLTDALLDAREQSGSLWLVSGESGVGKSRLLDELRTVGLVEGALVLRGQSVSGGGKSYQVWRDVIQRLVLSTTISNDQASVLKELVPDIERMLSISVDDPPQLNEVAQKERLNDTIIQVISLQQQPTLILLEDLHWAMDSVEPLLILQPKLSDLPVCIVGTYRTDEQFDLSEKLPDAKILQLERLNRFEIEALSVSMVGSAARQPGVLDLVERETEGNTFFIVEVMRALAEDAGQLDNIGRVTLPASVLTGGINSVIERRMNRVPEQYHNLLGLAAVAGRQLDLKLLQYALDTYDDFGSFSLDEWLSICEAAVVITIQDEQWQFSHDKLREYRVQQLTTTPRYHQYVAEAIETLYPDDKARYTALAEHWLHADNLDKALFYGIPAAKQMKDVSNYYGAIELLYDIYGKLDQHEIDEGLQSDLFFRLAELNERIGENDISRDYFERGYTLAIASNDRQRQIVGLQGKGIVAYNTAQYDAARQHLETALQLGNDMTPPEVFANIYKILSNVYSQQDEISRSNEYVQKALDISRAHNIQIEIAGSLNNLGVNEYMMGNYDAARDYYQQALDVYTQIGYRSGIALCYSNIADVMFDDGIDKQLDYYEKGLAIYRDIGNQWGIALCLENMSSAYYILEQFDTAIQLLEEALQISRRIGNRYGEQHELMELGFAHNLQGDYQQAETYLQESLTLARELDLGSHLALCLTYNAYNKIDLNEFDLSSQMLSEVLEIILNTEAKVYVNEALATYARLFYARGLNQSALLLCEFMLHQTALEDITRQVMVEPVYGQLKLAVLEDEYQQTKQQAQSLDIDRALQLVQASV